MTLPEVDYELNIVQLRQLLQTRFPVDPVIFGLKFSCLECLENALFWFRQSMSLNMR